MEGTQSPSATSTGWAVLGIGLNVALRVADLPPELHETAGTLGLPASELEPTLARVLDALERALALDAGALLERVRARDALRGHDIAWASGSGRAAGIDGEGRLIVELAGGGRTALASGEVHLLR